MPTSRLAKLKSFKQDTFDTKVFKTNSPEKRPVNKDS